MISDGNRIESGHSTLPVLLFRGETVPKERFPGSRSLVRRRHPINTKVRT